MSHMIPERILKPDNVLCNVSARGKKHCLEILSELLANTSPEMPHDEVFAKLVERERLGSTGLGQGVAIPHCRFAGIEAANAALLRLVAAVDFESLDDAPVDLVFGLVVPEEITDDHRDEIARISETLKDGRLQADLRRATTARELYETFVSGQGGESVVPAARDLSRGS